MLRTMQGVLLEPLLAGFSAGLFCCASCLPALAPIFAAEQRRARETLGVWLRFLGGRLAGYLVLGAAFGWLGERGDAPWLAAAANAAMIAMALVLIFYAVGFRKPAWSFCAAGTRRGGATPIWLGFATGFQACPPVLMSAAYVFTLHSALRGLVYFLIFFCATSVYLVPLLGVGWLGRWPEFRRAARLSAAAVGVLVLAYGILNA